MKELIMITLLIVIICMVLTGYALHKMSMRIDEIDKPNPPVYDHVNVYRFDVAGEDKDLYVVRVEYSFRDEAEAEAMKKEIQKTWR